MAIHIPAAIDPMALILSERAYLIWVEMHHPNVPALSQIPEVLKTLTVEEKKFAAARAQAFIDYGKALQSGLGNIS